MQIWIKSLTTSLIFLLISCLKRSASEVLFRESVTGSVEAGNYSYYSYSGNYKIRLVLTSLTGDADLYVSQADLGGRTMKPKFDLSEHDLQSITCGQDVVQLTEEFRRPIGIGVYGHPSHETSDFVLDVIGVDYFDDNDRSDDDIYITEEELQFYEEFFGEPYNGINKVPNSRKFTKEETKNSDNTDNDNESMDGWSFVANLLIHILQVVLEIVT